MIDRLLRVRNGSLAFANCCARLSKSCTLQKNNQTGTKASKRSSKARIMIVDLRLWLAFKLLTVGCYYIREVLQTEPVRFSERSASGFWPGRVKVHTNMCEPKVCSANRKLIFGFTFGSASSDGEATGDFQEDFGGNPVALESQSDKVVLARKNVSFYLGFLCKTVRGRTVINEAAAELFYMRESRSEGWMGRGQRRRKTTFT